MEAGGAARAKALRFPRVTCHMQVTARRSVWLEMREQSREGRQGPCRALAASNGALEF